MPRGILGLPRPLAAPFTGGGGEELMLRRSPLETEKICGAEPRPAGEPGKVTVFFFGNVGLVKDQEADSGVTSGVMQR